MKQTDPRDGIDESADREGGGGGGGGGGGLGGGACLCRRRPPASRPSRRSRCSG